MPRMKRTTCFEQGSVKLEQTGIDRFVVTYGRQVKAALDYSAAALELGACLMHQAACDDLLDNRERGERG